MRSFACSLLLLICIGSISAQQTITDSGTYLLHKFEQNIGKEKYTASKNAAGTVYQVDFKYIDRGSPVPLSASMQLSSAFEPVSFRIKGGTSRFSAVNDSVVIVGKTAHIKVDDSVYSKTLTGINFPVAGYSPATVQMLLIQYWKKNGKPKLIHILPSGDVQINKDGEDTLSFNNQPVILERYVIKGLVWGNELVWTDPKGKLFCLITNDAEGDKQEMMLEPYESMLSAIIDKAARYGMELFTKGQKTVSQKHKLIAISGGTVIDVVNNTSIPDATILIENGIIKKVGAKNTVPIPSDAFVIEAKGKTILPGLWDMHSHFEQAEWGPAYLAAGVTTVRDCGNEFGYINSIKKAIDNGSGVGPNILKAGIIDGKGPYSLGIIQASTKEEAIAAVQRYKENGFVQIKVYSSVKPDILKIICDEAHRVGLTVTGHVPRRMSIQQAVDSGMDMINHVQYVYSVMKKTAKFAPFDFTDSFNLRVINFLKTHHTIIDATIGVYELAYRSLKEDIKIMEPAFASLPAPMQPLFLTTGVSSDSDLMFSRAFIRDMKQIVNVLYHNDVTIVAGTDMGFPGFSLDRELELYVDAGLTPMQAIQTATITPANVMKMQAMYGSIEVGKKGDLIIIDGNPLEKIRNIRNVTRVVKDGYIYDPVELHRIAGFQ